MSPSPSTVRARALAAVDAVPRTFPLGTFVAANPLHGLEHLRFEDAAAVAAATSGASSFLTEAEYRQLHHSGRITDQDLRAAVLRRWPGPGRRPERHDPDVELAVATLLSSPVAAEPVQLVRTRSEQPEVAPDGRAAERIDAAVARWCAAYLDQGQADWTLPRRELGLFGSWRALAGRDPGLRRLAGRSARRRVAELPAAPEEALAVLVERLGVAEDAVTEYFRASLRRLPGWSAALARSVDSDDVVGYLALRMALEHLVIGELPAGTDEWHAPTIDPAAASDSIQRRAIWQEAMELGYRDELLSRLGSVDGSSAPAGADVAAQVVMCIDVRSEGMRRHLEQVGPYATLGFAGFFGLPVRIASLDHEPVPSCPVIVEPRATVVERPDVDPQVVRDHRDRHVAVDAAWDARHDAKTSPAAPFAFAEAAGWVLGPLAALRTFTPTAAAALTRGVARRAEPPVRTSMDVGPASVADGLAPEGLSPAEQVQVAHGALTTMGLTAGFAPLVVLCGHRSATTNNPYAAALDCGACAGKAGGPNARALAELLNRAAVRDGLAEAGIEIPAATWFVAAEHETTTDTVTVLDRHRVPDEHLDGLAALEADLAEAGARLAAERLRDLPVGGRTAADRAGVDAVRRRSADWAEPVPEWGLVGNAAVVVGPRALTASADLGRRVFLHSYDPVADEDGVALGNILTGPLVVGHWISSQYYFSAVDPQRHGAGTKPLHNVTGGIGVHEGPGGDLRVGLPLESVQFAGQRVHEPMRLLAIVQAPRERLDGLIERNAAVAQLLDNGWVRLVAGSGGPDGWAERLRDGTWAHWPEVTTPRDADPAMAADDLVAERDGDTMSVGVGASAGTRTEVS